METPYKDKNGRVISVDDYAIITTQYDKGVHYIVKFGEYDDKECYLDSVHCGFYLEIANQSENKGRYRYRYTLPDMADKCESFTPIKVTSTIV